MTESGVPKSSPILDYLYAQSELDGPEGTQRTTAWPLPTEVEILEVGGQEALRCEYGDPEQVKFCDQATSRTALDRLRHLGGAPVVRIRDFVQRFGPLFCHEESSGILNPYILPYSSQDKTEMVVWYQEIAALLVAVTRLATCARFERRIFVADLQVVRHYLWFRDFVADYSTKLAVGVCDRVLKQHQVDGSGGDIVAFDPGARRVVEGVVNWWLLAGQVGPRLRWKAESVPTLVWTSGLWGMIGAQLLSDIRKGGKTATCDGCGKEVRRNRRPKTGQFVWCGSPDCKKKRNRLAQERSRRSMG